MARVIWFMERLLLMEAEVKSLVSGKNRSYERELKEELLEILDQVEEMYGPRDRSYEILEHTRHATRSPLRQGSTDYLGERRALQNLKTRCSYSSFFTACRSTCFAPSTIHNSFGSAAAAKSCSDSLSVVC